MDYKEMNAIGIVRLMLTDGVITQEIAGKYFPELKENEDERIRKALIKSFNEYLKQSEEAWGEDVKFKYVNVKDAIVWLEKQGEQNPKFRVGDVIRHKEQGFTCKIIAVDTEYRLSECNWNGSHLPFDSQDAYELVEQKSAWSEEDKNFMYNTINNLTELKDKYGEKYGNVGKCIDWLKSLKDRCTWKPSDEQKPADNIVPKFKVGDNI